MPCAKVPPPRRRQPLPKPPPAEARPPRGTWRQALAVAAAVLLALLPVELARTVAPEAPVLEEWHVDLYAQQEPLRAGEAPQPTPQQKRAPCTPGLELEVSGACWLSLEQKPPRCPRQAVAYQGKCLLPVAVARRPPTSLDGGLPESR